MAGNSKRVIVQIESTAGTDIDIPLPKVKESS